MIVTRKDKMFCHEEGRQFFHEKSCAGGGSNGITQKGWVCDRTTGFFKVWHFATQYLALGHVPWILSFSGLILADKVIFGQGKHD